MILQALNENSMVGMVIWYKLLHWVNIVSKFLQGENIYIDVAINNIKRSHAEFQRVERI